MVMLNFNANDHAESGGDFSPIPAGKYVASIVSSDMKRTKAGDGAYLELVFEVYEGTFSGRKLWARLNLENKNDTAVKIAQDQLAAICRATGVLEPRDSVELHNIPICISVEVKNDRNNGDFNEIKRYSKREGGAAPAQTRPQEKQQQPPPWKR